MTSTFRSNDNQISEILVKIDKGNIQLPDFQRDWVWDDERIKALIASISCSYPVGALMFMERGGETKFNHRPFTNVLTSEMPEILVLDGQQRLTSIYCAMYSKLPVLDKKKNKRFYYIDIEAALDTATDRFEAIVSVPEDKIIRTNFGRDIELDLSTREKEFEHKMFPLNLVYRLIESNKWQNDYQKFYNYNYQVLEEYGKFNADVLATIQSYKIPIITLDKEIKKEAVCQVFENVNTGGVSLTVFELMTATFAADNFELRKDWNERYERMVNKSAIDVDHVDNAILHGVSSTDFLTALTLLARYNRNMITGEALSCKKKDVLNLSLDEYKKYADDLESGFIKAANFLKEQRIFSNYDLPYSTQLIPLSVLFTILGKKSHDGIVKDKLSQWYWCGIFGEMYGSANETRYVNDVTGVMEWFNGGKEPDTIQRAYFQPTRLLSLQTRQSAAYKGMMALMLKEGCQDFINGATMDITCFIQENTDIHHIFPQAYCCENKLERKKWNSIVNKTPIFARTNRIIGGSAPSLYLNKISTEEHATEENVNKYLQSHKINVELIRKNDFDQFFVARAKELLKLISQAMGKTISNLDSPEVIQEYGESLAS